jgi:hypothetical protein
VATAEVENDGALESDKRDGDKSVGPLRESGVAKKKSRQMKGKERK